MKLMRLVSLATGVVLALSPLAVEAEDAPVVTRVVLWRVKPGAAAKLDEGLKRHNALHAKQKDPGSHHTYVVISGADTGTYVRVAGGRKWSDFDAEAAWAQADDADSAINVDPYLASATPLYYRLLADVSHMQEPPAPAGMYEVLHYKIRPGHAADFQVAIKRAHEAIQKTQWPVHYAWFALANGADHPQFVLSLPRSKWADFSDPEKPFPAMLEEALGRNEADHVLGLFNDAVESVRSEILAYRSELSYVPASTP